jgi:hypothetical protein
MIEKYITNKKGNQFLWGIVHKKFKNILKNIKK